MDAQPGQFYLRLEWDDWNLIDQVGSSAPFRVGVISANYLVEKPNAKSSKYQAEHLRKRCSAHNLDWLLDPSTTPLVKPDFERTHRKDRALNSPFAKAVSELPLTPEELTSDDAAAEALVDAGVTLQLTSKTFSAPYLATPAYNSPEHEANVRLIKLARERAGDKHVVGFMELSIRLVKNGNGLRIARDLIDAGARFIFVRVQGLDPEQASAEKALAYMRLVEGIAEAGGLPVPDCVGRLGPLLLSARAHAFCSGAIKFRRVPGGKRSGPGMMPKPFIDVVDQFYGLTKDSLPANPLTCFANECPAQGGHGSTRGIATHNAHELERLGEVAARGELEPLLRSSARHFARSWADALAAFESGQELAA